MCMNYQEYSLCVVLSMVTIYLYMVLLLFQVTSAHFYNNYLPCQISTCSDRASDLWPRDKNFSFITIGVRNIYLV